MGLGFIFFSMVELAIVLILKQKQEWVNAMERITINKAESEDIFFKTRFPYYVGEGTTFRENERNMHRTKTQKSMEFEQECCVCSIHCRS